MSQNKFIKTVDQILNHARKSGIIQRDTQDKVLTKNVITIDDQELINFGSCSYLGLEFNEEVRSAAKSAIDSYGTQFSSSRAYVSPRYYQQLEKKLKCIFNAPTIVTPTTTLGHIAAIPILVSTEDAVILDHQVHNSVQTAVNLVKAKNTHVELIRHNRMDLLEAKIIELKSKYRKIWYMADGIYSMYGDTAPLDEIYTLLDKHKEFNFYVDDAHGMSCFGSNGQGYVLSERKIHERMIVATSFAKAFATGGGALIFPNEEIASLVRNCGGPLITSGPMQPSALGAANCVADLHLSGKIQEYQEDLNENIKYTNMLLEKYNLPNLAEKKSPIFFIAVSFPKVAYNILDKMKKDGHFLNLGIFPAVPIKNTGVRFTITRMHTFEQIQNMVSSMAKHFSSALIEEKVSIEEIYKAFKIKSKSQQAIETKVQSLIKHTELSSESYDSIKNVNANVWNELFASRGAFDHNALNLLENSFRNNEKDYQNWNFEYFIVRDSEQKVVLATFLTVSISKDDMLSDKSISEEVEQMRLKNPSFMTSKTLSIGSPVTEGNHLYLDENSTHWKEALDMLVRKINDLQEEHKISTTIIRDLPEKNSKLDDYFMNNSFIKYEMPDNCRIADMNWSNQAEYYKTLTNKKRGHFRRNVLRKIDLFNIQTVTNASEEEVKKFYNLYLNVKRKSLEINTFTLPFEFFKNIANDSQWEILSLSLKDDSISADPVAVGFCYKGSDNYSFAMVGIDYDFNYEFGSYRQMLWQVLKRANDLGYKNINLGYTSTMEKRHFGAEILKSSAYMQIKDNYTMEAIGTITIGKKREDGIDKRRVLPV